MSRKIVDAEFEVVRGPDRVPARIAHSSVRRPPFWRRPIRLPFGLYLAGDPVVHWALIGVVALLIVKYLVTGDVPGPG